MGGGPTILNLNIESDEVGSGVSTPVIKSSSIGCILQQPYRLYFLFFWPAYLTFGFTIGSQLLPWDSPILARPSENLQRLLVDLNPPSGRVPNDICDLRDANLTQLVVDCDESNAHGIKCGCCANEICKIRIVIIQKKIKLAWNG